MPNPTGGVVCPTIYGLKIFVDPELDEIIGKQIYYFGEYEAGTIHVLKNCLSQGSIFVDLGASIGLMSCVAAKLVGQKGHVYAFEPSPSTYRTLKFNLALNGLSNTTAFNIAVGSKNESAWLYKGTGKNPGSNSLIGSSGKRKGAKVKITTLDKLVKDHTIETPTLIKIDIEGYELEALKGAENLLQCSSPPILIIEYSNLHPQHGGTVLDIYRFLQALNNYHFYKLRQSKSTPSRLVRITEPKELPHHDNVFCFPKTHMLSNRLSPEGKR
jgi:FkbM family methyltransferase